MKVIQKIQSLPNEFNDFTPNDPVEIPLYTGDNLAFAMSAMAHGAAESEASHYRVIEVRLEF